MTGDDGLRSLLAAMGNGRPHDELSSDPERLRRLSSSVLQTRRIRRSMFPDAALRESCWDILLLCFHAEAASQPICVKQIRSELEESSTSVLRRVQELEDARLVERRRDDVDGRRTLVRLTADARQIMSRFLLRMGVDSA